MYVANMTHIAPWAATAGLVAGAAAVLAPGGLLAVYGPFKLRGSFTTDSNRAFHERLVARCARADTHTLGGLWGPLGGLAAGRAGMGGWGTSRPAAPPPPPSPRTPPALSSSNPEWGYRDSDDVTALADAAGLSLLAVQPMPANNFMLMFTKRG